MSRRGFGLALLALLAGCAVGPDYAPPAEPPVSGYLPEPLAPIGAQHFVAGLDLPGQWWDLFHSAALNDLITQALKANPDLAAAEAALRMAQETRAAAEAAFWPVVSGEFTPSRQKSPPGSLSSPAGPNGATGPSIYSLYTAQLSIAYAPDVFGGTRRQVEQLTALEENQRFQLEAAYLSLTSNVVAAALGEAGLRGQIAATEAAIRIETDILNRLRRQRDLGDASELDVLSQQAALQQSEASLPPLTRQLAQQRNLLAALIGQYPDADLPQRFDLAGMTLPADLPVSLPSQLLAQRPDIAAAAASLHAASAAVGVAIANELPQITLSATSGTTGTRLSQLFTPGFGAWSLGGNLAQTIFDGGALLHQRRAADAALDQAAAQYRSTVVTAFQNVADCLRALQSDAEAVAIDTAAEQTAAASLDLARRQRDLGAISTVALLNAEQAEQQAKLVLVQAEAARLIDTAALFQAMGGGWWHRQDRVAAAP